MHCFEKEAHNDVCKQGDGLLGMANNFSQENVALKYFLKGNSHFWSQDPYNCKVGDFNRVGKFAIFAWYEF